MSLLPPDWQSGSKPIYIYSTPEADNLLLDRLSNANLRYPKAVVVEAGFPWGARGNRQPLPGSMSGT